MEIFPTTYECRSLPTTAVSRSWRQSEDGKGPRSPEGASSGDLGPVVHVPVPLENRTRCRDLQVFHASGSVRIFIDQAAQDGFSADLLWALEGERGGNRSPFGPMDFRLVRRVSLAGCCSGP